MLEKIAYALREAQKETGIKVTDDTVLVVDEKPSDEGTCCGMRVVYVPTFSHLSLGNCQYKLARAFEFYMGRE